MIMLCGYSDSGALCKSLATYIKSIEVVAFSKATICVIDL